MLIQDSLASRLGICPPGGSGTSTIKPSPAATEVRSRIGSGEAYLQVFPRQQRGVLRSRQDNSELQGVSRYTLVELLMNSGRSGDFYALEKLTEDGVFDEKRQVKIGWKEKGWLGGDGAELYLLRM